MSESNNIKACLKWETLEQCQLFAQHLAQVTHDPVCIALNGTLGAGKTQFVRFFVEAMGGDATTVSSPTFVLVNQYHARVPIAHLDLYRLKSLQELDSIGFADLVFGESICLVEWANKFPAALPEETLWIDIIPSDSFRSVELSALEFTPAAQMIHSVAAKLHL